MICASSCSASMVQVSSAGEAALEVAGVPGVLAAAGREGGSACGEHGQSRGQAGTHDEPDG
jgi:hypothetical protein